MIDVWLDVPARSHKTEPQPCAFGARFTLTIAHTVNSAMIFAWLGPLFLGEPMILVDGTDAREGASETENNVATIAAYRNSSKQRPTKNSFSKTIFEKRNALIPCAVPVALAG